MTDDLEIHELGPKADGIHRSARGPIYVDRTLPGDVARTEIHRGSGGVQRGNVLALLTPSPHRGAAPCPNYDMCGGCTVQHAAETYYRDWKVGLVRSALDREGLSPAHWREPVFVPAGTRRRVTFATLKKNGRVTLGYFRRRSHQVAEIATCLIAEPAIMELRTKLVEPLGAILQEGKAADVFIQSVDGTCEVVITGPVGKRGVPDLQVHEAFADMTQRAKIGRIAWRARDREEPETMVEAAPLRARFGTLDVTLPPLAFLQPTKAGERALIEAVTNALPKKGKVADLFAGCGTFSGAMLERGTVDAYDNVESAMRALEKAKGPRPLKATSRDLFRDPLAADELARYDAIVFDPPRVGALEQAKVLATADVPLVLGVSCNPATFARDARLLVDGGYQLDSVQVIDQFTWTHHVELVASFTKD